MANHSVGTYLAWRRGARDIHHKERFVVRLTSSKYIFFPLPCSMKKSRFSSTIGHDLSAAN